MVDPGQQSGGARIWMNTGGVFDRLVAVIDGRLLVANPQPEKLEEAAEMLRRRDISALSQVVGKTILLEADEIRRIKSNLKGRDLTVKYKQARSDKAHSKEITMDSQTMRDQVLQELEALCQGRLERSEVQFSPLRAAVAPFVMLAITGLATWLVTAAARDLESGGEPDVSGRHVWIKRLFVWVLDVLGPTGGMIVGGIVGLIGVLWLVRRTTNPPLMATLTPRDGNS